MNGDSRGPLPGDVGDPGRKVEVLVIGGGIIGLSVAYYLSKRNVYDVTVVEREGELTQHASGHNAGGLAGPRAFTPEVFWPLYRETFELYRGLARAGHFDFEFEEKGTTSIAIQADQRAIEKGVDEFRSRTGSRAEFLNYSELHEREPNLSKRIDCGIFYPDGAQGNSKKVAQYFARMCTGSGTKIATGTEVSGFETSDGRVREVKTTRGTLRPEKVVIAAGPWSGEVASLIGGGLDVPVSPVKGHLVTTEPSASRILNSFINGPDYYVLQSPQGNIVVGGGEDSVGFDVRVDEARASEAWREGVSFVPALQHLKQESKTACLRPYGPGGLPIIGPSGRYSNLIFATGHHRSGFCLAPITGKLVSDLIVDGGTTMDLAAFSPDRFGSK